MTTPASVPRRARRAGRRSRAGWIGAALVVALQFAGCATGSLPGSPERVTDREAAAPSPLAAAMQCTSDLLTQHGVRGLSIRLDAVDGSAAPADAGRWLADAVARIGWPSGVALFPASQSPAAQSPTVALQATFDAPAAAGAPLLLTLTPYDPHSRAALAGGATGLALLDGDGPARFIAFGQAFSIAAATTRPAALRALVDAAAIDLVGRLARVPYWTCLGLDGQQPAVIELVQDWYDALAADPAAVIGYFQHQLRHRRVYDGPVDGAVNDAFKDAVAGARASLGLAAEPKLTLDFFRAYLDAPPGTLTAGMPATGVPAAGAPAASAPSVPVANRPGVPAMGAPVATGAAGSPAAGPGGSAAATPDLPLALSVRAANDARRFARGESILLAVRASRDAHVYCFLQDEQRQILRFFPNRFQPNARVASDAPLLLPGAMQYQLEMNRRGITETVACFATWREVLADLPPAIAGTDLSPLPVASLEQVRSAFARAAGGTFAHDVFELRAR
ncbi:MAG: DUF4384 domain-containing protein [Lautropia sp.]